MGVFDGILPGNDPRMERLLRRRIEGKEDQASFQSQRAALGQASRTAATTAARGADAGLPPALAQRMAGQQQQAAEAGAAAQFSRDRRQEVAAAEQGLADMKAQRGAFMRQLLGKGLSTVGALGSQLGVGASEGGAPAPAGGGTHMGAGNPLLGAAGGVAGMAVGGPLGASVGTSLGGMLGGAALPGGTPQTMSMVDQAMANSAPAMPQPAPQMPGLGAALAPLQQPGAMGQVAQQGAMAPGASGDFMRLLLGY